MYHNYSLSTCQGRGPRLQACDYTIGNGGRAVPELGYHVGQTSRSHIDWISTPSNAVNTPTERLLATAVSAGLLHRRREHRQQMWSIPNIFISCWRHIRVPDIRVERLHQPLEWRKTHRRRFNIKYVKPIGTIDIRLSLCRQRRTRRALRKQSFPRYSHYDFVLPNMRYEFNKRHFIARSLFDYV